MNLSRGMRFWDRWQVRGVSQPGLPCPESRDPSCLSSTVSGGRCVLNLDREKEGERKGSQPRKGDRLYQIKEEERTSVSLGTRPFSTWSR